MASYKTKIARLNALLDAHGICGKCGELYEHTYDEPFASCKCGCSEWYKLTPHMQLVQKLHAEIARLQSELAQERKRLDWALKHDSFYDHTAQVFYCDPAFKIPHPGLRVETTNPRATIDELMGDTQ